MAKRLAEYKISNSELKKEVKDILNMMIEEISLSKACQLIMQDTGLQTIFLIK